MKSVLLVFFISLVMIVMTSLTYVTYFARPHSTSPRSDRRYQPLKEEKLEEFENRKTNRVKPFGSKDKKTYNERNKKDARSKLDIKVCSKICLFRNEYCTGRLAQLLSTRYRCHSSTVRFPGRSNQHGVVNGSPAL